MGRERTFRVEDLAEGVEDEERALPGRDKLETSIAEPSVGLRSARTPQTHSFLTCTSLAPFTSLPSLLRFLPFLTSPAAKLVTPASSGLLDRNWRLMRAERMSPFEWAMMSSRVLSDGREEAGKGEEDEEE